MPVCGQGEGRDGGAQHGASEAVHYLGCQDGLPCRPESQNKRAHANCDDGQQSWQPPVVEPIDEGARWQLACQSCECPDAKHEANVSLGPSVLGQNDSNERPKPGLHGGDKEVNRVQIVSAACCCHAPQRHHYLIPESIAGSCKVFM